MNNDKKLRKVLSDIARDLPHDSLENYVNYLEDQACKAGEYEDGMEILLACSKFAYDALPPQTKRMICDIKQNGLSAIGNSPEVFFGNPQMMSGKPVWDILFEEITDYFQRGFKLLPFTIVKAMIEGLQKTPGYSGKKNPDIFNFNEPFEKDLFEDLCQPENEIKLADIPVAKIYYYYGNYLVEYGQYNEALQALDTSLSWNPFDVQVRLEFIDVLKRFGKIDDVIRLTKELFDIAFYPQLIAQCLRNLGYCFIEKQLYREAKSIYLISLLYDPESQMVKNELNYIDKITNGHCVEYPEQELDAMAQKFDIPLGPANHILDLAYACGMQAKKNREYDAARYYLTILYNLTENSEIKDLLEKL